eukprot:7444785-Karenia_brevis.AAC.1
MPISATSKRPPHDIQAAEVNGKKNCHGAVAVAAWSAVAAARSGRRLEKLPLLSGIGLAFS